MAVVLEDPRQRVAVGGVAPAGGDQRAGRVGGDELDQDPLGRVGAARAEPLAGREASTASARRCQASDRNRLRKPGPATSAALQVLAERAVELARRCRSAITRGAALSTGASSIAALVE